MQQFARIGVPEPYGIVSKSATTRDHAPVRAERDGAHVAQMPGQCVKYFTGFRVPQADFVITGGGNLRAIHVKVYGVSEASKTCQSVKNSPRSRVPTAARNGPGALSLCCSRQG